MVMEELLAYYENVSAKVLEFSQKYKTIKRVQIEKSRRTASYEEVIKRIQDRVRTKLDKDFKCYDMIKEIEEILDKREKREEEYKEKNFTGRIFCEENGIALYFNKRNHRFSSSSLRKEVLDKQEI